MNLGGAPALRVLHTCAPCLRTQHARRRAALQTDAACPLRIAEAGARQSHVAAAAGSAEVQVGVCAMYMLLE